MEEFKDIPDKFSLCPRCGSNEVEWSNCRDLNILESFVECPKCELRTFSVETMAFIGLKNLDYITSILKYNQWCATNPTCYGEEKWDNNG